MSSGAEISPGNVPVYYGGSSLKSVDRRIKVAEIVLRCLICGLGFGAAVIVGTDEQVKRFFTFEKRARFTDMKALVFLVIVNGTASGYSLLQGLRCCISIIRGSVLRNKPLAWAIFSFDQAVAYVALSAMATTIQSAVVGQNGQPEFQWMKVCDMYKKYCRQMANGVALAIIACLGAVLLSCISAFNLFRLYGKKKERESSSW